MEVTIEAVGVTTAAEGAKLDLSVVAGKGVIGLIVVVGILGSWSPMVKGGNDVNGDIGGWCLSPLISFNSVLKSSLSFTGDVPSRYIRWTFSDSIMVIIRISDNKGSVWELTRATLQLSNQATLCNKNVTIRKLTLRCLSLRMKVY
jgi:hypothetical protein